MLKARLKYIIYIILVIVAGLISRKIAVIPLWIGDLLWALMIYLMVRFLFIKAAIKQVAVISLTFCFIIEFSQLYQAPWINQIRQTLPGRLILGQGFLWSDLLAYTGGILIGMVGEKLAVSRTH